MARQGFTGKKTDKQSILYMVIGIVSLLLWLIPVMLGQPLPFDWAIIVAWLALAGFMIISLRQRDRKKHVLMHTAYFDEDSKTGFSPYAGAFECTAPQELIDRLIVIFADMAGRDMRVANIDAPEDFSPTLILETSHFTFRRDEDVKIMAPVHSPYDVTVEDWRGRIVDAHTGERRRFSTMFELEEAF